jgi:prepilin-type N-terminal cleavage/methylation domain-containing protein
MSKKKGFTLVEVVLVILILGVLAGIVIPRLTYTKKEAEYEACNSAVSAINAMLEYAHVANSMAYPADNAAFKTFLANTDYFPDQPVTVSFGSYTVDYNTTSNRAYRTP